MSRLTNIPKKTYTPAEFAKVLGHSEDFVRKMCRGAPDSRTGKPAMLPNGWRAVKVNRDWKIEPEGLPLDMEEMSFEKYCEVLDDFQRIMDDGIPDSALFAIARDALFLEVIKPYLQPGTTTEVQTRIPQISRRFQNMLSDQELANIIEKRWSLGLKLSKITELSSAVKTQEQSALPYYVPMENLSGLLAVVREAYVGALSSKSGITLQIEFKPDGTWTPKGVAESVDPFLKLFLSGAIRDIPSNHQNTLLGLFDMTWHRQLYQQGDAQAARKTWYESSFFLAHPHMKEFRSRCLYCGKVRAQNKTRNERSHAECCDHCRASFHRWMMKNKTHHINNEKEELNHRILERLRVVSNNIS